MEIVAILRTLWRRRVLVALGLAGAIGIIMLLGEAKPTTTAFAWTQILSDTSKSQLVYPEPLGGETTGWRGQLAIDSLLTTQSQVQIATAAGIPSDQLLVVDPVLSSPLIPASLPRRASKAATGAAAGAPYQLALSLDTVFPIIHVEASAPDRAHAKKLVEVATSVFELMSSNLDDRQVQGLSFTPVGTTRTKLTTSGGGRALAIAGGLFLFLVWCGAVAFVSLLLDQWRARRPRKISAPRDVDFA